MGLNADSLTRHRDMRASPPPRSRRWIGEVGAAGASSSIALHDGVLLDGRTSGSRLSEMSLDELSDLSSQCSDASDAGQSRLSELDDWPQQDTDPAQDLPVSQVLLSSLQASSCAASQSSEALGRLGGRAGPPPGARNTAAAAESHDCLPPVDAPPAPDLAVASCLGPRSVSSTSAPETPSRHEELSPASLPARGSPTDAPGSSEARRRAATLYVPGHDVGSLLGSGESGGSGSAGSARRAKTIFDRTGLEAGERSRVEAERRQLEAQAAAALAMQRKVMLRVEAERAEWAKEKEAFMAELATGRDALLQAQQEARLRQAEAKKLSGELSDARAESKRAKEQLMEQLRNPEDVDGDDILATQRDLQGKLEKSEKHAHVSGQQMRAAAPHPRAWAHAWPWAWPCTSHSVCFVLAGGVA
jgi:hypothetical protein